MKDVILMCTNPGCDGGATGGNMCKEGGTEEQKVIKKISKVDKEDE